MMADEAAADAVAVVATARRVTRPLMSATRSEPSQRRRRHQRPTERPEQTLPGQTMAVRPAPAGDGGVGVVGEVVARLAMVLAALTGALAAERALAVMVVVTSPLTVLRGTDRVVEQDRMTPPRGHHRRRPRACNDGERRNSRSPTRTRRAANRRDRKIPNGGREAVVEAVEMVVTRAAMMARRTGKTGRRNRTLGLVVEPEAGGAAVAAVVVRGLTTPNGEPSSDSI